MLIRPARTPEDPEPAIIGESIGSGRVIERLAPALEEAWPEYPRDPADLKAFLEEASSLLYRAAAGLQNEPDFVPAAGFSRVSRDRTFEYVKLELVDVQGGLEAEGLWQDLDAFDATAAITRLTRAGLMIKLRALGAFVVHGKTTRMDEMTAADFFPNGNWKQKRDPKISETLESELGFANKQLAHITLTRPLPEDVEIYASSQAPQFERVIRLFSEFNRSVDPRLVPDWWPDWFDRFSRSDEPT